ncbi:MAG: UbiA prenyltransferase family protein [Hyphomicrobiales bacterium]
MTETSAAAGTSTLALRPLVTAMRPYQWPKNVIVFAAFVFSAGDDWTPGDAGSWWPLLWRNMALFALWCLAASATYLLNDILDREADRIHPRKRFRPIASGELPVGTAKAAAIALVVVAIPLACALNLIAGLVLLGYTAGMALYSLGLKEVAILDVIILVGGVVARAVGGALVIDVDISPWLYVCTSFGAFFFASSKRWAEYRQLGADAAAHRAALRHYSGNVLDQLLTISAASALLSYALYTIESVNVPENGTMALTLPFVAFALFRYLLLLNGERRTDAPDRILFTDPQILMAVVGFVVTALVVMAASR